MATMLDEILTGRSAAYAHAPQTLDELDALVAADPYQREIVPPDDTRTKITDVKKYPFRWICTIVPTFKHPTTGKDIEMATQAGSGFLIGPNHVLTAAHVLFPTDGPLKNQAPVRVKVTPGHDGRKTHFGRWVSTTYKVRAEWRTGGKNTFNASWDIAMIVLPEGIRRKKVGHWGQPGTNTLRFPLPNDWLKNRIVNVGGYPRDKPQYTQWIAHDGLDDPAPTRAGTAVANVFKYKADTCLGQSGAPVWYWDGKLKRYLVGVHTGSCDFLDGCTRQTGAPCMPGGSRWSHNRGVLLTKDVDAQIKAWLK
jgi:V8-like Glu-specific endopeptidase